MPSLLERHETSQSQEFQRRVLVAALGVAARVVLAPEKSGTHLHLVASRLLRDPEEHAARLALVLCATDEVARDGTDEELVGAVERLLTVYRG